MNMAQSNPSNTNSLPGIVTDQPEIFESEPALSDDTGVNDLDLHSEPTDEAIALIEVPIKQAFSYFAERENEIAKFYVQRHGEYKISGDKPEEETDIEKYHRLVSEVTELLNKFQADSASKSDKSGSLSESGVLNNKALTCNLEILSKQLKALEFAAKDGSLSSTQSGFNNIKDKLQKLGERMLESNEDQHDAEDIHHDETAKLMRMSALERRLNLLETLLGHDEDKTQSLLKTTNCESLTEAAETLSSWLTLFKPDSVQRVSRELDYWTQRIEKMNEIFSTTDESKFNPETKAKLDQLCNLITTTNKDRAMVSTIIHRLNAMEELQQKAAHVITTMNHLEQVQTQITDSLQSNKTELTSLNKMFAKNIELIKGYSADIDSRISAIRERSS